MKCVFFVTLIDWMLLLFVMSPISYWVSLLWPAPPEHEQVMRMLEASASEEEAILYLKTLWHDGFFTPMLKQTAAMYMLLNIITYHVLLRYNASFIGYFLGYKIVDMNMQQPSDKQIMLRLLGLNLSMMTFGLGYIIACFNKQQVTLHDYISNTRVVKAAFINNKTI